MTDKELKEWNMLRKQIINGYHVSDWDKSRLINLNYLVMEQCHKIHNDNMIDSIQKRGNI
jgi:hypothetical protein